MKLKDIKSVMTFEAFRPEPDDNSAPWRKRFPKKRTLLLNVSRKKVTARVLDKTAVMCEATVHEGDFKDVVGQMGLEWKEATDGGWCAISLNSRFVVSLEANLSRRKGGQELLRSNPKAALGAKAERGKRYVLTHNSESNTSLLLATEEDPILKLEAALKENGLQPARLCVGAYAMLLELIEQVRDARRVHLAANLDAKTGTILMAACCDGSLCALVQQEEQWVKLRSRSDLYSDDMTPAVELLLPMIEEAGPQTHVLFMNDIERPDFVPLLESRAPGIRVSDVTVPNQLWNLMADL
ncbi:MAG: hypothetical protein ACR2OZ_07375 [Verrucomicrobiales bacterium]